MWKSPRACEEMSSWPVLLCPSPDPVAILWPLRPLRIPLFRSTRFLDPLTVTVISNLFSTTVLVLLTTGSDPDTFTLERGEAFYLPRMDPDLLGTIFLNLTISLPLSHLSLFRDSSNFYIFFTLLNEKNKGNKIYLI